MENDNFSWENSLFRLGDGFNFLGLFGGLLEDPEADVEEPEEWHGRHPLMWGEVVQIQME
jgi:hypothetical protein